MKKLFNIICVVSLLFTNICASICPPCGVTQIPGSPFTQNIQNPVGAFYSPDSRTLIVVNNTNRTVSSFCVNDCNCQITNASNIFTNGLTNASFGTISPCGTCVAVSNFGLAVPAAGSISLYSLNQSNCTLSLIRDDLSSGGNNAVGLAFSPDGNFLAAANEFSKNITVFTVNKNNCNLTSIGSFSTGNNINPFEIAPIILSYSPDGKFLAVTIVNLTNGVGNIGIYDVNKETGDLTNLRTTNSGGIFPTGLAFSPNGKFLAVTNSDLLDTNFGSTVLFDFDSSTGALTQNSSVISSDNHPIMLSFSPNSRCLGIANSMTSSISILEVNQITGKLSTINDKISVGNFPRSAMYSPDGSCLAVANSGFTPTTQPPNPIDDTGSVSIFRTNYQRSNLSRAIFAKYCAGCRN